jgi:hypothetical protein
VIVLRLFIYFLSYRVCVKWANIFLFGFLFLLGIGLYFLIKRIRRPAKVRPVWPIGMASTIDPFSNIPNMESSSPMGGFHPLMPYPPTSVAGIDTHGRRRNGANLDAY